MTQCLRNSFTLSRYFLIFFKFTLHFVVGSLKLVTLIFSLELIFLICKSNLSHIFSPEFSQNRVIAHLFYTLWNEVQLRLFLDWKLTISDLHRQSCHSVSISFHFWPYFKNDPFVSDPSQTIIFLHSTKCPVIPFPFRVRLQSILWHIQVQSEVWPCVGSGLQLLSLLDL